MKKLIYYFLSVILIISLCSCSKNKDEVITPDQTIVVDAKKALTGTFVDFWGKENWSKQEWEIQFQEMKEIGMNTAIIQFVSYGDNTYFNSTNTFTTTKYPNALASLLAAANAKEISVFIGLYFNDEYWDNQTNVDWLRLHADRCISIATEINSQFGKDPAFKGWYIPHEPEPNAYNAADLVAVFKDNLVNRISDKLHSFDSKPVSIAAFFSEAPQGAVTIDRIKSQLQAEMPTSHITKAVSYQYYSDMCPTGPGGSDASWLRFYYLDFIKSLQ
jgi:hypothetical protein